MKHGYELVAAMMLAVSFASAQQESKAKIGERLPDGTAYAGISPNTHKPMYTTPVDAGVYSWKKVGQYCTNLEVDGHRDWRMPSKGELNVLFQNRAAIGGFDTTGSTPDGSYWSAPPQGDYSTGGDYFSSWLQRFSDGIGFDAGRFNVSSLRCVR